MRVSLSPAAERDADVEDAWWRENRTRAPNLFDDEVAAALLRLRTDAMDLPVFRRVRGVDVRRLHLPKTRRHIYYAVDRDRVTVLAIWGSVRAVLPRLRARLP